MLLDKILSHKRFALFAPFIGLLALTLLALLFWAIAAGRIADQMAAQGVSWQQIDRHGFPARITLALEKPRWRSGGSDNLLWTGDALSLTTMPFNGKHAIVDFIGPHRLSGERSHIELAHNGNLMSLVGDEAGLLRGSFEAIEPVISGVWAGQNFAAQGEILGLHMRRNGQRQDVALVIKQMQRETTSSDDLLPETLSRFDLAGSVPTGFFKQGPNSGDLLVLDRLTATADTVTVIARGRVKLRQTGLMDGTLDLDIVNFEGFIDRLIETGMVRAQQRQRLLLLASLGAALGGDTQDRLSVPLSFSRGRTMLGPLDIGPAPLWK